jgi:hypothetical protein
MIRILITTLLFATAAQAAEIRFSGDELAGFIQHAFIGTRIRLHQEAKNPGELSWIDIGSRFNDHRFVFAIPPKDIDLGLAGRARYVVNDIRSAPEQTPITAVARDGAFVIRIKFEDEGTELKGTPIGRLRRIRASAIPDVQIRDIHLLITLRPSNEPNAQEIRFQPSQVTFLGATQAGGLGNVSVFGRRVDLLNPLTDYKRVIRSAIEREVKKLIDRNLTRLGEQVTQTIRARGGSMGMRINSVRFAGTDLVITGSVNLQ